MNKQSLSFWQIWNMSFGFFGIQFGWALQLANMSSIYEYLGAKPDEIPILWLAAPMTGLIVQPIVGYMSDRTWSVRWGRRRPYFFIGAIFASITLIIMPYSSALWMAAGLLWILDSSINVSMEPFRAFVVDKLNDKQRNMGFSMQSIMIGIGAVLASSLPYVITSIYGDSANTENSGIPWTLKLSFTVGGIVFFGSVLYTILTSSERPPENMDVFLKEKKEHKGIVHFFGELFGNIKNMPKTMRRVALVQFFTWPGLFLMWFYFVPAVAVHVFEGGDTSQFMYQRGSEWGGICFAFYSLVTFGFSWLLPHIANRWSRRYTHLVCLLVGGFALISIYWIVHIDVPLDIKKWLLFIPMTGIGIAWASILAMPYAMISETLPVKKIGIYMGIFNFFIVLPEIVAATTFNHVMGYILNNNRLYALMLAGCLLIIAAILCMRIPSQVQIKKDI